MSGYIEAGYVVTLSTLALYGASLVGREHRLRRRLPPTTAPDAAQPAPSSDGEP